MSAGSKIQVSYNRGERNDNVIVVIGGDTPEEFRQNAIGLLGQEDGVAFLERVVWHMSQAGAKDLVTTELGARPVEGDRFAHRRETTAAPTVQQHVPQPMPPQEPQYAPPPQPAGPIPTCAHGQRVHRSGTSSRGPWEAWFCPLPKERKAEQCKALFVNN